MSDDELVFLNFFKKNCPKEHILKNSYPHINFALDKLYLEFKPQFLKIHHDYYQDEPQSVSFDMANDLEAIYGDLLFPLNLEAYYEKFKERLTILSKKYATKYIDEWEDVNFDGNTEAHYLYSFPILEPIEPFITQEMKEKAKVVLKNYQLS